MAFSLSSHEVSDLCLGKPPLRSLPISATIGDALSALKITGQNFISIWSCNHSSTSSSSEFDDCRCIGKVCVVDIVSYLCREENLSNPFSVFKSSVSVLLNPQLQGTIQHVEPHFRFAGVSYFSGEFSHGERSKITSLFESLLQVIDLIVDEGAQNLIVPIKSSVTNNSRKKHLQKSSFGPTLHDGREFCWITQEDVIRFLLSLIGLFSPLPTHSIESLNIIDTEVLAVDYHDPAYSAVNAISSAVGNQTSVAVIEMGKLIGEISPLTLCNCEETVAAAITTLSAGDLMAYIDCGGPPEDLVKVVKSRLKERNLTGLLDLLEDSTTVSSSPRFSNLWSSSDEESCCSSPCSQGRRSSRYSRSSSYSARLVRRSEAIVCNPRSSLVAVMIQALAHRVNYVWVIEDDYSLVGIVTFQEMLKVFREHLN